MIKLFHILFLVTLTVLPLSTDAFIEGIYCGTENCYEGKRSMSHTIIYH